MPKHVLPRRYLAKLPPGKPVPEDRIRRIAELERAAIRKARQAQEKRTSILRFFIGV